LLNKRAQAFDWGSGEKVRGVNLGGWLVLEPWITPSIFQRLDGSGIIDEYTLTQKLGAQAAHDQVLKPHWDNWVQLSDFQKIKASGFNLVRIPVGYWAFDNSGSPYAKGAADYLEKGVQWARQVGVKVIIDLHGAPGSQNGFDNSGQKTSPGWQQGDTVARTLSVLRTIQEKYASSDYDDVVAAIENLNEPLDPALNPDITRQFHRDSYGNQRVVSQSRTFMFHDGFMPPSSYNGFLTPSDNNAQQVVVDHHEYSCFTNELVAMVPWQHRQHVCNNAASWSGSDKWSIVGEWSGAMTDCAAALNGYGIGARYDGTYPGSTYHGSCDGINFIETWSQVFKDDMRGFIEAQLETFERNTNGW
jgi:glucan 1,3-beta-glucosidase